MRGGKLLSGRNDIENDGMTWRNNGNVNDGASWMSCHLFLSPRDARSLREKITLTISGRIISKRYVFSQVAHLCTLTCCAARPRPGSSRHDGHRASTARAAEGRLSTRWLGSQSSRPRGSGRILLASIHGRVLYEIRPEIAGWISFVGYYLQYISIIY